MVRGAAFWRLAGCRLAPLVIEIRTGRLSVARHPALTAVGGARCSRTDQTGRPSRPTQRLNDERCRALRDAQCAGDKKWKRLTFDDD